MNQTNSTPTPETLEIWRALDEIDQEPCIGRLTQEEKDVLFDEFFSKEAKMARLQRIREYKQAAYEKLASLLTMEKQLVESLQE
jgi:hypothetical protein